MSLRETSAAIIEPLTVSEAKTHLRILHSEDDTYIATLIAAARSRVEIETQRSLITRTYELVGDSFPASSTIALPMPPLRSVTTIKYYDSTGTLSTFASTNYRVDTYSAPGRVELVSGSSWPTTQERQNAVEIVYVAGYGDLPTAVPAEIRQAILMLVAHWYGFREPVAMGAPISEVPKAVEYLCLPHRVF